MPENLADKNVLVEIIANGKTRARSGAGQRDGGDHERELRPAASDDAVNGKSLPRST